MHCLPAYHDIKTKVGLEVYNKYGIKEMEVTDEVFRSNNSTVFDEAENRVIQYSHKFQHYPADNKIITCNYPQ